MASNVNRIRRSTLVHVKDIGEGSFSDVYQMIWDSPNGPINVAAKKLHKKDKHELEILTELDHQNIIKLIGVVDETTEFMLILELCEGGSLRSYLKAQNGRGLSLEHFFAWATQAARPIEYLQEKKFVHKDIKSPNYMVTLQNTLKLGDFGITKNIDQTIENATTTASYPWMAPELLVRSILSPKFDIFALAVVLWELWTGRFPWEGIQSPTIMWKVCNENERLPIPEDCPEPIQDLLKQCWLTEWKQRPDIIQVLQVILSTATATLYSPSSSPALQARRQTIVGPWKVAREFGQQDGPGKISCAFHITLTPKGLVVITDRIASSIKIYRVDGVYLYSFDTDIKPWQIVISSNNTCFMTDCTQYITMYDLDGSFQGAWESFCPHAMSSVPELRGIAIDHTGDLLLGDITNKCVHKHRQDGTHVESIKVGIEPRCIAVTSQGTIVIADWRHSTAPQIISNTGEVLYTLRHPDGSTWSSWRVYCHDGIIFVSNLSPSRIYCYSESGNYLTSMPVPCIHPYWGLVMTSDSKTLLLCQNLSVEVFTAPSIQQ